MDIEKLIEAIKLYGIDTDTALYSLRPKTRNCGPSCMCPAVAALRRKQDG